MRLERMKTTAPVPALEIETHLHSRPVLARLITAIPDYDEPRFNDAIRACGLDTHKPQGRYACQVYKDFVMAQSDNAQRALERAAKNPSPVVPQHPPRPKNKPNYSTQNVAAPAPLMSPSPARAESDEEYAGSYLQKMLNDDVSLVLICLNDAARGAIDAARGGMVWGGGYHCTAIPPLPRICFLIFFNVFFCIRK